MAAWRCAAPAAPLSLSHFRSSSQERTLEKEYFVWEMLLSLLFSAYLFFYPKSYRAIDPGGAILGHQGAYCLD